MTIHTIMPRPNLFIIGSMKSGTSYLHGLLDQHPQVFMSRPKEPSFFVADHVDNLRYQRDLDQYIDLFSGADGAQIIGEASTNYTKSPSIPCPAELIREFCPTARLIYLMRDPVERAISHYWHAISELGEKRDPRTAFADDDHYVNVSRYAMQLRPYLSVFDRRQILPVIFEELINDPRNTYAEILRWLGVDERFVPDDLDKPRHVTPSLITPRRRPPRVSDQSVTSLRRFKARFRAAAKQPRPIDRSLVDMSDSRSYLRNRLRAEVEELRQLLGMITDKWDNFRAPSTAIQPLPSGDRDAGSDPAPREIRRSN